MEGWERELQQLKDVDAPASTRSRMEAGSTGDRMPPVPNRGQRVAAGVVACVVFLLGAAVVTAAFRQAPTPVATTPADAAVLTLIAAPNDAVATVAFRGTLVDPAVGSHCWVQDGDTEMCMEILGAGGPEQFLVIPEGTPFALVNENDAAPVHLEVSPRHFHAPPGADVREPISIDQLDELDAGDHVLTVTASWEGRGENIAFHFGIRIETPDGSPSPSPTEAVDPFGDLEEQLTGSSWQLASLGDATLDLLEAPTLIFGAERIGGSTGCNRWYGSDTSGIEDGRLVLGETAMTLVRCPGETGAVEENFLAILSGEPPLVSVDGFTLTLSTDDRTATFERIDVDHDDIVGSFLDCAVDDRVDVGPASNAILEPAPPAYFTVNLAWIEPTDEIRRIAGSPELDEGSRWVVVRDGLVVAEVDYPDLTGIACPSAGA